ncbi:tetratricopeptide repeat protein [Govanella unica]|uniref:Tetratricopeptide repeat protein n=1 Tax=Govanella unica TaxID=2975056 RepID=A0A9X3TY74_9PROT|nr:hypothetical protein [Govania unica]MDA5193857.1 hypothetical protein [Govania unica]
MSMRSASTIALSTALALLVVASSERPLRLAPVPEFLNPAYLALTACGKRPETQSIFLRKDFRLALMASASADPALKTLDSDPPLDSNYGKAHFPISSPEAYTQAFFDQGLRLVYGFNHWEAERAFRAATRWDPNCAICYWGQALVLGPHINAPMDPASLADTLAALGKAKSLIATASPIEKALISALDKRYTADPTKTRAELDQAYASAMAAVYAAYPKNPHIAILYAEAVMDTSPWDYWEADATTPKPAMLPAIKAVEAVMAAHPDHAGANHLYIHLMEASRMPDRAEGAADRLATEAPMAGHLVHMPGHIYFRVGRYQDALTANRQAVAVDERYLSGNQGSAVYRYGYYPHNVHFLLASAGMAGDGGTALEAAAKLDRIVPTPVLDAVPWLSHPVKASVYFAEAQFGEPSTVLQIPMPPAQYPYLQAMWHYARGIALAESGQGRPALAEADAIATLIKTADLKILTDNHMPARDIMTLAELVLRGKAQASMGNLNDALIIMQQAAAKQRSIPYTEPPYWYYPVEQSVGAILLRLNRPTEAIDAFNRSLMSHPNNAWSLYGLWLARQKTNDPATMATEALYRKAIVPADVPPPALERL